MLSIRFVRIGKKKHPIYRIVVMEKGKNPQSSFLENLGTYNPHNKEKNIKKDRVDYWLTQGATPTATVHNLLVDQNLVKTEKVRASKTKPGKKKQAQIDLKKSELEAVKKTQEAEKAVAEEAKKTTIETVAPEVTKEVIPETTTLETKTSETTNVVVKPE